MQAEEFKASDEDVKHGQQERGMVQVGAPGEEGRRCEMWCRAGAAEEQRSTRGAATRRVALRARAMAMAMAMAIATHFLHKLS